MNKTEERIRKLYAKDIVPGKLKYYGKAKIWMPDVEILTSA